MATLNEIDKHKKSSCDWKFVSLLSSMITYFWWFNQGLQNSYPIQLQLPITRHLSLGINIEILVAWCQVSTSKEYEAVCLFCSRMYFDFKNTYCEVCNIVSAKETIFTGEIQLHFVVVSIFFLTPVIYYLSQHLDLNVLLWTTYCYPPYWGTGQNLYPHCGFETKNLQIWNVNE